MTLRDDPWPVGTPCWVDVMTSDVGSALSFYGDLFGWQLTVGGPESGGYAMAELGGRAVAGIGPIPAGQQFPPSWTTYLAVTDAAATARTVAAAGGTVLTPAFDVLDAGTMAVVQDPTGGVFGLWQAGQHFGAAVANEPNALSWNELVTRDYQVAKDFYAAVFGYTYTEMSDENFQYCTIEVEGSTVGGLGGMPADVPAQVPAYWRVYFAVEDVDAAMSRVAELGGSVLRPAEDMPYGRWGDVADPQGATFSLIKPAPGPA